MSLKTSTFDTSRFLETEEDIALYLEATIEDDASMLPIALGNVARARGMSELARETGITRAALYRSLSEDGDPKLSTIAKVLDYYGTQLSIKEKPRTAVLA